MARDGLGAALATSSVQAAILVPTAPTHDVAQQHSDSALHLRAPCSEQVERFRGILGELLQLPINSAQQPELTVFDLRSVLRQIDSHSHSAVAWAGQLGATWCGGRLAGPKQVSRCDTEERYAFITRLLAIMGLFAVQTSQSYRG